ncbi:POTRA domain-containing protein, partial [Fusobacterium sp.]
MKKVVVFLLFLVNTVIFAAVANLSVKNIEVVNNQEVPAEVVLSAMSLKEGNTFSSEAAVDDFQKIKATGYFDDVVIQPITQDGGVKVVVNVFEKADVSSLLAANGIKALQNDESVDKTTIISNINVIGNKSLSAEEVTDIVGIKKGDYLSTKKIEDAQKKLLASG